MKVIVLAIFVALAHVSAAAICGRYATLAANAWACIALHCMRSPLHGPRRLRSAAAAARLALAAPKGFARAAAIRSWLRSAPRFI